MVKRTIDKIKELKEEKRLTVLMAEQNLHPGAHASPIVAM